MQPYCAGGDIPTLRGARTQVEFHKLRRSASVVPSGGTGTGGFEAAQLLRDDGCTRRQRREEETRRFAAITKARVREQWGKRRAVLDEEGAARVQEKEDRDKRQKKCSDQYLHPPPAAVPLPTTVPLPRPLKPARAPATGRRCFNATVTVIAPERCDVTGGSNTRLLALARDCGGREEEEEEEDEGSLSSVSDGTMEKRSPPQAQNPSSPEADSERERSRYVSALRLQLLKRLESEGKELPPLCPCGVPALEGWDRERHCTNCPFAVPSGAEDFCGLIYCLTQQLGVE